MKPLLLLPIFALSFVVALVALVVVLTFELIVNEYIVRFLALNVAAVLAALSAGWLADRFDSNGQRTRFLPLALSLVLGANLLELLLLLQAALYPGELDLVPIVLALFRAFVLALFATGMVQGLRIPAAQASGEYRIARILLLVAIVAAPVVLIAAGLLGFAGA